jgi:hypothetical protein
LAGGVATAEVKGFVVAHLGLIEVSQKFRKRQVGSVQAVNQKVEGCVRIVEVLTEFENTACVRRAI